MSVLMPEVKYVYQNHLLDSTRWQDYRPRDDDIIIATTHKSGTTWMQMIVMHLIFQDLQPRPVGDFSPWIDFRPSPRGERVQMLEAQEHRRCSKTHLPLDGLPYFPQVKYIVVGRDVRDLAMSLWNHYSNFTEQMYQLVNDESQRIGPPLPTCPATIDEFWHNLMTRGWFEWENEGYPFWTVVKYVQTWWDFKHLDNILFVHFSDLLQDLEGEIQRVADYLGIDVAPEILTRISQAVTFSTVKANAAKLLPGMETTFKGGSQTFINKGTNGRWRHVLTESDLKLFDAAISRELTPECAHWLEHGRLATP